MSINRRNRAPQGPRHISVASLDTNASGIAESTISLGLSRFPEPPSSIPSTPLRTNFETYSPSRPNNSPIHQSPISPVRRAPPPPPSPRLANQSPSLPPRSQTQLPSQASSQQPTRPHPSSSNTTSRDWQDAASSIGVDADEDRLLPTSFITSLLQENKELRKNKRNSYASDAFSGISEMTYPPLMKQSDHDSIASGRYVSGRPLAPHRHQDIKSPPPPPSSFPQSTKSSKRNSDGSETLHSLQNFPSAKTAVSGRGQPNSQAPSYNSSQISAGSMGSMDKGYQKKLSTTYETGDELAEYKALNNVYGPTPPSTAGLHSRFPKDHARRNSMQSTKSTSPSFISRISGISLRRVFPWRKVKPLPPVPLIPNIPVAVQNAHRKEEESTPLPELVNRAGALRDMLDKGYRPYDSLYSDNNNPYQAVPDPTTMPHIADPRRSQHPGASSDAVTFYSFPHGNHATADQTKQRPGVKSLFSTRRRRMCFFSIIVVAVLAAVGAGVGISIANKKSSPKCSGNLVGAGCTLDATCICTATIGCNGLARALIDLIPTVNKQFQTNFTSATAYTDVWMVQGSTNTNCVSQALLVDVGTGIDQEKNPNRTQWAQAALMWNALQTQDMDAAQQMTQFVKSRPWSKISAEDGPISTAGSTFSTTISGYSFDFAAQTVTEPPATFKTLGQPTNVQISRTSPNAQSALDRMYSFAQASSLQQQNALKKYWASVLLQRPADLLTFKTALSVSPILLPFNASSPSIRNLYTSSPTSPFPPPIACFPGLTNAALQQINSLETNVFALPNATSATTFNPSCYRDRPIYGVLDVLRLRLPFLDSRTGVVRQAAVLTRDATPRAVVYNGELLSTMVNGSGVSTPFTVSQLDPRQYGTLSFSDHVILQYLSSMKDINVANALVKFVLGIATKVAVPPDSMSLLYQSLGSIPALEVAVFGDVPPSDLTYTVAPFLNPSGSFFFGSDDASALRAWSINNTGGSMIVWTQNTTSPLIVRDKSLDPQDNVSLTFKAITAAILRHATEITLDNITTTFQGTGNFSPT